MKRYVSLTATVAVFLMMFSTMLTASASGKGDFNMDGKCNTLDVRAIMSASINNASLTRQQIWWGDYNIDDAINTTDARMLLTELLDDAGSVGAPDYAHPTGEDYWGENSIAILGDSISFGAKADDPLPENTYAGYLKKAVQKANGGKLNYGFASAYPTSWSSNRADEIHKWPDRSKTADGKNAWVCDQEDLPSGWKTDSGTRLTSVAMMSWTPWSTLTYTLRSSYASHYSYFCVYYHTQPGNASFALADGKGGEVPYADGTKTGYIQTDSATEKTLRTAFFKLSDCPKDANGLPQIIICHDGTTKPVVITGIGYYKALPKANNADGYVTVNSFTRGGMRFSYLSDTVLKQAASADTLIFSLGYNDAHYGTSENGSFDKAYFTERMNFMIDLCNKNGTNVIVNNTTWPDMQTEPAKSNIAFVHSELRRLARETNGIYLEQISIHGDALWEQIWAPNGDGVHPSSKGQKMMAQALVEAMGLEWTESWT